MDINFDTVLAIVGVILTIVLGYLGLRYTLKYRKKTDLLFLKNSSISLFKTIVKNLDDVEITFKGNRIDENLIAFKGTFFNNGNVDIDKSIIHKPLEVELPPNYSWVSHKIIDTSEDLNIDFQQIDNKLVFNWDLLKEGEYFTFDSLVEYKSEEEKSERKDFSKQLVTDLKLNHRITNLKTIGKENKIPRPIGIGGVIFMSVILLGLISAGYYVSIGQFFFPKYQVFNSVTIYSTNYFIEPFAENDHSLTLKTNQGDNLKSLTKEEYQKIIGNKILIQKENINYWYLILFGLFSTIYLIFYIFFLSNEIREKRLYKKLKKVADNIDDFDFEERRQVGIKLFEIMYK
jgi:hypothetical protein